MSRSQDELTRRIKDIDQKRKTSQDPPAKLPDCHPVEKGSTRVVFGKKGSKSKMDSYAGASLYE